MLCRILRKSDPESFVLYLWRNRPTIVIGRNQNPWKECNLKMMASRDVLLARRTSGGGSVYHDMGNSNYTVVMPREAFTRDKCAEMVSRALHHADIPAYVNERHDVAVEGRKISGSAFKLTNKRAFHHGTMLIDADLGRLHGCLHSEAKDDIEALGVESVRSVVTNLREYSLSIDHLTFCQAVMSEFGRTFGKLDVGRNVTVWDESDTHVVGMVEEERKRISTWKWLYGQTPRFVHRFGGVVGGKPVVAKVSVYHGHITEVSLGYDAGQEDADDCGVFQMISDSLVDAPYVAADVRSCLGPISRESPTAAELCRWILEKIMEAASGDSA
ncbi:hypothetical protein LPJ66_006740 [Kickxella alabastrina]|uniref:Uncharacterized protein n=1 Tax=Kickxella alabastrina TaxID=61397 RepID=A0ACC1IB35_9FUNG|nr:hypothetical protein LPJ66_006740 [Kickxella alabastrina]